ncbi:molecular chaperone TorD [Sansalvadorimonas sp. 2012CJ34-2]|uniref:Chaperone protein TorD n=1 Tax=Parendozoicomonas callyspongiae TaxID=2942213 RepID=A0ABT0PFX9_9GAMM|nr:molecular chaperone TorD [Sansalvadorimonas sp. 2012CJ34-2]MCL6269921.1 molecular chaperone TorD [Sansalvadorimonas sp. 2012CJ34-2]
MSDITSQNRAQMYWWLSSLVAMEFDEQQLEALFSDKMNQFMGSLAQEPELKQSAEKLMGAVSKLRLREDLQLELAADYAGLFLGAGRSGVQPYASVYLSEDGLMMQEPHHNMVALLKKHGFAQTKEYKEPADHLAVILDFMGNLAVQGASAEEQLNCLDTCLLSWLDDWSQGVEKCDSFGFYAAVSDLIVDFCRADRKQLNS